MSRFLSFGGSAVLFIVLSAGQSQAIDVATGPLGSNIQAVRNAATQNANETRTLGWNLNGSGVNLGQVEGGRPGDPSLFNAALTQQELFHPAVNPGGVGVIGVAIAGVTAVDGTNNNQLLSGHATSVAGMMVAQNVGGSMWGSAPARHCIPPRSPRQILRPTASGPNRSSPAASGCGLRAVE